MERKNKSLKTFTNKDKGVILKSFEKEFGKSKHPKDIGDPELSNFVQSEFPKYVK